MEKKQLKERFIYEKTGIEYLRQGDYIERINICVKFCKFNGKNLNFMI